MENKNNKSPKLYVKIKKRRLRNSFNKSSNNTSPKKKQNPTSEHYVNNGQFLEEIIKYQKLCRKAKSEKITQPKIPDAIGQAIYDIANRLSKKYNFAHIQYKDEMVLDGIEVAIKAVHNHKFNPKVTQNPFAYFTQIIFWSFLRRINTENKEKYIRYKKISAKLTQEMESLEAEGIPIEDLMPEDIHEFMQHFERRKKDQSEKAKTAKKIKQRKSKKRLSSKNSLLNILC
jgi:hypothetical protein